MPTVKFCLPADHASKLSQSLLRCVVGEVPPTLSALFLLPFTSLPLVYLHSHYIKLQHFFSPLCLAPWSFQHPVLSSLGILLLSKRKLWGVPKWSNVPVVNINSRNCLYVVCCSIWRTLLLNWRTCALLSVWLLQFYRFSETSVWLWVKDFHGRLFFFFFNQIFDVDWRKVKCDWCRTPLWLFMAGLF